MRFLDHVRFGSFVLGSSSGKVLMRLQEVIPSWLPHLCRDFGFVDHMVSAIDRMGYSCISPYPLTILRPIFCICRPIWGCLVACEVWWTLDVRFERSPMVAPFYPSGRENCAGLDIAVSARPFADFRRPFCLHNPLLSSHGICRLVMVVPSFDSPLFLLVKP